jgi:rubrerythrin
VNDKQVQELLYQALETEAGGQEVYRTAIGCAENPELEEEWNKYLAETAEHERILLETFVELNLDPARETPGREVVRHIGRSLVEAMNQARSAGPVAAQLVAAECIVLAETKDHQNWQLLSRAAEESSGRLAKALRKAVDQVEDQEDEHLYHSMGWTRELWLESLGIPAVLPPPEEERGVKTAIGAARAAQARKEML